jgi:hypothetical protein
LVLRSILTGNAVPFDRYEEDLMDGATTTVIHFSPVLLMLCVVALNHAVHYRRGERKLTQEGSRLRIALRAELQALLDLYTTNIDLLRKRSDHLLSSRSSLIVYKSNIGRLPLHLDEAVLTKVINVYARNDRLEATVAVHATLKCGLAFKHAPSSHEAEKLKRMYIAASRDIISVCDDLDAFASRAPTTTTITDESRTGSGRTSSRHPAFSPRREAPARRDHSRPTGGNLPAAIESKRIGNSCDTNE